MSDVVVTGIGVVHPLGFDAEALMGSSSLRPPEDARASSRSEAPRVHLDGEALRRLDDELFRGVDHRVLRRRDRLALTASLAAGLALRDAALPCPVADDRRYGLVAGTTFAAAEACLQFHEALLRDGPDYVSGALFTDTGNNIAAAHAAVCLDIRGPVLNLCSGLLAGLEALVWGVRWLRAGRADVVLAGGFDLDFPALAPALESEGLRGLRPTDGACFVVLERSEDCARRDAAPHFRILAHTRGTSLEDALVQLPVTPDVVLSSAAGAPPLARRIRAAHRRMRARGWPKAIEPKWALGETFSAAPLLALVAENARPDTSDRLTTVVESTCFSGAALAILVRGA